MKICKKCKRTKPLSEFYTHPKAADGHLSACKKCVCEERKRRYQTKRVEIREKQNAKNAANPKPNRDRVKQWRIDNPEKYKEQLQRAAGHKEKDPVKLSARRKLNGAVRHGRIIKPNCCERCSAKTPLHGHHIDYSKPLEVEWLCATCHGAEHYPVTV